LVGNGVAGVAGAVGAAPAVSTLACGLQRKGGNLNLSGQAPYKLKIGAPAAVEILYLGNFYVESEPGYA
jgi:hypothetical protein